MDDIIILVSNTYTIDEYGVERKTSSNKQVFAQVHSVTRTEFFQAGRNGLNPAFHFTVFAADYSGETVCQYNNEQYSIYRSYHVPGTDYIELYVERKGGTNVKESTN